MKGEGSAKQKAVLKMGPNVIKIRNTVLNQTPQHKLPSVCGPLFFIPQMLFVGVEIQIGIRFLMIYIQSFASIKTLWLMQCLLHKYISDN